jgi:hypothetical protein
VRVGWKVQEAVKRTVEVAERAVDLLTGAAAGAAGMSGSGFVVHGQLPVECGVAVAH